MSDILMFVGEYAWLSNFHPAPIVVDDCKFPSVEHAFQAFKTQDNWWFERISTAKHPGTAKKLGRKAPLRPDWEDVCVNIMRKCIRAKFTQNPDLAEKLLATGNCHIEEGNTWGDCYWGTVNRVGQNILGILLMETREELRNNG